MQTLLEAAKNQEISALQMTYLQRVQACSPFMARLLAKDADLLSDLLKNHHISYGLAEMQQFLLAQEINDETSLKKALRQLRQRVLARIIMRDLNGLADVNEVMQTTTNLAEVTIQAAVSSHTTWLAAASGLPLEAGQYHAEFIVIGMGKLGGGELNVSSDVDLIFAFDSTGDASPEISHQDFFNKLGKKVIAALDDVTEDGFVFRVDMRLRPFGSEGILVPSLDALEDYYQNNGREWERYAWIKGRVLVGKEGSISNLLKPFVFRKYLDFGAFASMRDLKVQIQRDVMQKGLQDNIKLGRGGIREIEFIAQVFQLIRGGQDASLQVRPTLQVLNLLKNKGLLQEKTVQALTEAYVFLRNLEHRLMYVEDAQTQDLPTSADAQQRIAEAMNFAHWADFLIALNHHRELVQAHFDETFSQAKKPENNAKTQTEASATAIWDGAIEHALAQRSLVDLGFTQADETLNRLQTLHQSHRYKQLPELSRQRVNTLMPLVITAAGKLENADIALMRCMDFLMAKNC